ncbi:hypothetical protein AVEN_170034-1 [Araneus ventricosus]|uniref:Uncharacterized protein n=1 Tax=Araneus ventricosus TaxID=182803 RepID=A0A4Y2N4L9_ARAVE|nr:hypothetical protein AVEN_170034-1 [Araneus ventricosus]
MASEKLDDIVTPARSEGSYSGEEDKVPFSVHEVTQIAKKATKNFLILQWRFVQMKKEEHTLSEVLKNHEIFQEPGQSLLREKSSAYTVYLLIA